MNDLNRWLKLIDRVTVIKLCIWCLCWFLISYFLQFGSIFLCISIIYFIFNNLGKRKAGELSAYSVFNNNYEQIAGTFDASYYENMLRGKSKKNRPKLDHFNSSKSGKVKKTKRIKHPVRMSKSGNIKCPCNSGKKYKKCCMKIKLKQKRAKMNSKKMDFSFSSSESSDTD